MLLVGNKHVCMYATNVASFSLILYIYCNAHVTVSHVF